MREVSSRIRRPCSPNTSCVCVARITSEGKSSVSGVSGRFFFERRYVGLTDVCDGGGNSDFNSGVTLLGEFSLEEFIQLSVEDSIGYELASLGNGTLLSSHLAGLRGMCLCRTLNRKSCVSGAVDSGKQLPETGLFNIHAKIDMTLGVCAQQSRDMSQGETRPQPCNLDFFSRHRKFGVRHDLFWTDTLDMVSISEG